MESELINLSYEIELKPGEKLTLPESLINSLGAGRWLITIVQQHSTASRITQSHDAFLKGYAPEDEGLYDEWAFGCVVECGS